MTLDQIALKHKTDKSSAHHNYCVTYERFFERLRHSENILLELGFGGYNHPDKGGQGLRTWSEYFENSECYSIDIFDKIYVPTHNTCYFKGSQTDAFFLDTVVTTVGNPNIIIDDASHNCVNTITSFNILWPMLSPGGIYVIEDLETSYWDNDEFEGGLYNPKSTINVVKTFIDRINYKHSGVSSLGIKSISFFEKLIFIEKI